MEGVAPSSVRACSLAQGKAWGVPHSTDMDFASDYPMDFEFWCIGALSAHGLPALFAPSHYGIIRHSRQRLT